MSRAYTPGGRFSSDFETKEIWKGVTDDLTNPVGTTALWYIYDAVHTEIDPLFDVGDSILLNDSSGKVWTGPFKIPVIRSVIKQGDTKISQQGFYGADYLHMTINALDIEKIAPGTMLDPDNRDRDRVVWKNQIWRPFQTQQAGIISETFVLLSVDLTQVMPEEMVNDPQFQAYAN